MRPDGYRQRGQSWDRWARGAVAVWLTILVGVGARSALQPRSHSLYPTYAAAGGDWAAGAPLYRVQWEPHLDQYRYSPLVAVTLVPFHYLPERLGNVLWRLLNAGALLGAFAWWLRRAAPVGDGPLTARQQAVLFLLIAPLSLSSLNNGQPNLLVTGLLLAAVAGAAGERWTLAAACVALAGAFKVYPLALGMLLVAVYPRRFAPRFLLALAVAAALPFLFQHPDYVAGQYRLWYERLREGDEARKYWPLHMAYRDLWLLFRVAHVPITSRTYLMVQLLAAGGCVLVCVAGRRRGWPRREVLAAVLTLGACWMTLCGPATESCTYVLLAPALAWGVLGGGRRRPAARALAWLAFGLFQVPVLAGLFPDTSRVHAWGPHPLAALLFLASYLAVALPALAARPGPAAPAGPDAPPARPAAEAA
jgi:hypothetical protein